MADAFTMGSFMNKCLLYTKYILYSQILYGSTRNIANPVMASLHTCVNWKVGSVLWGKYEHRLSISGMGIYCP